MEDKYSGTVISLESLTDLEREEMQKFSADQKSIAVPAGIKHQVVTFGNDKIGIAISRNGRENFRAYSVNVVYTSYCSTCVGMRFH